MPTTTETEERLTDVRVTEDHDGALLVSWWDRVEGRGQAILRVDSPTRTALADLLHAVRSGAR